MSQTPRWNMEDNHTSGYLRNTHDVRRQTNKLLILADLFSISDTP